MLYQLSHHVTFPTSHLLVLQTRICLLPVVQALGQEAAVLEIDSDGDLRVAVNGLRWLMSPVSCTLVYDPNRLRPETIIKDPSPDSKRGNHYLF